MTFRNSDSLVEEARRSVSRTALAVAMILLATGLVLAEVGLRDGSFIMLRSGSGVLLAIPVLNVVAALLEEVGRRDWPFVAAALVVLALVAYSVVDKLG